MQIRHYGDATEVVEIPRLTQIQHQAYDRFLQRDIPPDKRECIGLEAILQEVFPISNFDGSLTLRYISYELGRARYTVSECRVLKLTYGSPLKLKLVLDKKEPVEEDVYLGEIPIMIGGGEFIINGAERVIVSQLHRSPGVDFALDDSLGDRKSYSCWIIPDRGSWIEITVSKKDTLQIKIDQNGKFSAVSFLRALSPEYSTNLDIVKLFHETQEVKLSNRNYAQILRNQVAAHDIVNEETGEILCKCGEKISDAVIAQLKTLKIDKVEFIPELFDRLILNSLAEDATVSHDEALVRIYQRLRPGNPASLDKAKQLFFEKFFDPKRYRLGRVGRFRLNRKFQQNIPTDQMVLSKEDFVNAIRYLMKLRSGQGELDDIDHLGNRRVRTIDELAGEEIRKGFLKLTRTIQDRLNMEDAQKLTPREVVNSKTVSSAIDFFFGRGELSQVVDQTNPLSQVTHERRLSALGPGGLNRKRAGFDVRDVHISHYGRICPIETPEGANIGLIASLCIYSSTDEYGFLITPYRVVENGIVTSKVEWLRADQEDNIVMSPADAEMDTGSRMAKEVMARHGGDFFLTPSQNIKYIDVSSKQLVGVSASLIPFLEHDDANRALMGSNMQRQAVPLIVTQQPLVMTGMEKVVAENSSMVVTADEPGAVTYVDAERIVIEEKEYTLKKFFGLNERTCQNQRPIVKLGDKVKKGQVLADGAGTKEGVLSLGKNVIVAFMPWDGYNFEDAILVSQRLLREDVYTSIHIEEFSIEIRETKLGREEFTNDIPNVPERALKNLNEDGICRVGTYVRPGDILVGKIAPKSKGELSPEEKLLRAIFGRSGEDVKNDSLEVPSGVEGIVIDTKKYSRRIRISEEERRKAKREVRQIEKEYNSKISVLLRKFINDVRDVVGSQPKNRETGEVIKYPGLMTMTKDIVSLKDKLNVMTLELPSESVKEKVRVIINDYRAKIEPIEEERERSINHILRGVELPAGVLEMVKVYIATKRTLSVGDKMAGRHGNKGVIARILPIEDMPFLADGTPVDIVLNPLGVPSRMNVGQLLETHLGWAAHKLGFQVVTPVFGGASEEDVRKALVEAGMPDNGKVTLYDGRTGEAFEEKVTVGNMYMLKLHHLVDDKVHARATGPYSLITQQPLGGKARFGGQRFGEMEVWALEAYGAAYILQELLTVKSDDVDGRTKIYESMVKGENMLEPGTPVSFEVLINEIRGLGLNMTLEKRT